MKKIKEHIGLAMIVAGAMTLLATRSSTLGHSNTALLTGLLCIVAGITIHIRQIKKDSLY